VFFFHLSNIDMKLRIKGNSLRLRLTQSEVARIGNGQSVEESISFSPEQTLTYVIVVSADAAAVWSHYAANRIAVVLPLSVAKAWVSGNEVGINATQPITANDHLKIIIEKDFTCLTKRTGDDDKDTFPHPEVSHNSTVKVC
jgi:hypothetical protein